jgi:hypothetical protein
LLCGGKGSLIVIAAVASDTEWRFIFCAGAQLNITVYVITSFQSMCMISTNSLVKGDWCGRLSQFEKKVEVNTEIEYGNYQELLNAEKNQMCVMGVCR